MPATGPQLDTDELSPDTHTLHFNIRLDIFFFLCLGLPNDIFRSRFMTEI